MSTASHSPIPVLIVIESTQCVAFSPKNLAGQQMQFPKGAIENMEISHADVVFQAIATLLDTAHIERATILLVFGPSLSFEKNVPFASPEKIEEEKKVFAAATPFDRVGIRAYKAGSNMTLVSVNRDLFDTVREGFSQGDSVVCGIIPRFLLSQYLDKGQLTPKAVNAIFQKISSLSELSVIPVRVKAMSLQEQEEYLSSRYQGVIIVVFLLFLGLVGALTWFILMRQANSVRSTPAPVVIRTPAPSSTPSADPEPTPPPVASASGTKVVVFASARNASISAQLSKDLSDAGFIVQTGKRTAGVVVSKTQVILGETVSVSVRTLLESILRKTFKDFSISEGADLGTDVRITLGP